MLGFCHTQQETFNLKQKSEGKRRREMVAEKTSRMLDAGAAVYGRPAVSMHLSSS